MTKSLDPRRSQVIMAAQKIPIETLQKIRQHIKNSLILPESENHPGGWSKHDSTEELPEPSSLSELGELFSLGSVLETATPLPRLLGQWFVSVTNPGDVLFKLPGLQLKPGLRLVSYLYRTADDGNGITWAVPASLSTTAELESALVQPHDRDRPPAPTGALEDPMDAVCGDRSPLSFIVASMLRRELRELGALGKSCTWSHHRLVNAVPAQVQWQWRIEMPKSLSPKVLIFPNGRAAVEFFTCRIAPPIALFQHVDQYAAEHYRAVSTERAIAIAQR